MAGMLFARRVLCGDQQVVALCLELCLPGNDLCADGLGVGGCVGHHERGSQRPGKQFGLKALCGG
jgi:hypothetical protein